VRPSFRIKTLSIIKNLHNGHLKYFNGVQRLHPPERKATGIRELTEAKILRHGKPSGAIFGNSGGIPVLLQAPKQYYYERR
jgi:hypothetical protein